MTAQTIERRSDTRPGGKAGVDDAASTDFDLRVLALAIPVAGSLLIGMAFDLRLLTTAGALLAILLAILSPAGGLVTIAFMAPLQQPLVLPAPGFEAILVAATLLGCVYRLPIDRPRLAMGPALWLATAFIAYVAIEQSPDMLSGWTGDQGHLVGFLFLQLLTGFGLVLACAYVLRDRRPYPIIVAALCAAIVGSLLAMATFGNPNLGVPLAGLVAAADELGPRAVGAFGNPNYFGLYMALALAAGAALLASARTVRVRAVLLTAIAFFAVGLALSLSRGAIVALLAGLVCLAFVRDRRLGVATILVGIVLVVAIYPAFVAWRLGYTNGVANAASYEIIAESDGGRILAALAGPTLFLSSPLFGVGWGQYSFLSAQASGLSQGIAAHNWYVQILAELGAVGVILWALLLVVVIAMLLRRPRTPRLVGLAVLATYIVGSLFAEPPSSFQTSALAIIVIVAALVGDWTPRGGPDLDEGPAPATV